MMKNDFRILTTIEDMDIHLPLPHAELVQWFEENIYENIDLESIGNFYPVNKVENKLLVTDSQRTNIFYLNLYLSLLGLNNQDINEVTYTSLTNLKKEICTLMRLEYVNYSLLDLIDLYNKDLAVKGNPKVKNKLEYSIDSLRDKQTKLNKEDKKH